MSVRGSSIRRSAPPGTEQRGLLIVPHCKVGQQDVGWLGTQGWEVGQDVVNHVSSMVAPAQALDLFPDGIGPPACLASRAWSKTPRSLLGLLNYPLETITLQIESPVDETEHAADDA